jgi:hypothetical protein
VTEIYREGVACDSNIVFLSEKETYRSKLESYIKNMHQELAESGYSPVICEGKAKGVYRFDTENGTIEMMFEGDQVKFIDMANSLENYAKQEADDSQNFVI